MSPEAVLDMIRRNRQPQARVALVTATVISPLSVTCQFEDGSPAFQPLILGSAPVPAVGARVLLLPSDAGWVYASTLITPATDSPYEEQYLQLHDNWEIAQRADASWFQINHGTGQFFSQGHLPGQAGDISGGAAPRLYSDKGAILSHQAPAALAALAAQSATVHLVDVQVRRNTGGGPDLVSPVLYGHTYDAANPPPADNPPWAPGFGPLRLAPLGRFETGRYALPATWVTALAAGTIRGIGFWATTVADGMFSNRSYLGQDVASMNILLRLVYTLPAS